MDFIGTNNKKSGSGWHLLVIFLVISVILITFWFREDGSGPLHSVRNGVSVVSTPIATAGAAIAKPFVAVGNAINNISADSDDITTLQEKNNELTAQIAQLEEYRQENERLTALLDIESAYSVTGTASRIIGRSTDSYNRTITIDKGNNDGISAGMPVMDQNGLIGQIDTVGPTSAVVRLLSDESSGVAALIQSTREEGVVTGSVEGLLYLQYIPVSSTVSPGDVIITSGIGGVYPKGIVIGEVLSVDAGASELYDTIVIKPVAADEIYEEVLVLTGDETEVMYAE